jgi:hypothetical protein
VSTALYIDENQLSDFPSVSNSFSHTIYEKWKSPDLSLKSGIQLMHFRYHRAILFYVASTAMLVVQLTAGLSSISINHTDYQAIRIHLSVVGLFLESTAQTLLLFCLVDLGLSFLYIWQRTRTHHNMVLGAAAAVSFVLFILALAYFGKSEAAWTAQFQAVKNSTYDSSDRAVWHLLGKLGSSYRILQWIATLGVLAFSIFVLVLSKKQALVRNVCFPVPPFYSCTF